METVVLALVVIVAAWKLIPFVVGMFADKRHAGAYMLRNMLQELGVIVDLTEDKTLIAFMEIAGEGYTVAEFRASLDQEKNSITRFADKNEYFIKGLEARVGCVYHFLKNGNLDQFDGVIFKETIEILKKYDVSNITRIAS
jgi:hypothetical protein